MWILIKILQVPYYHSLCFEDTPRFGIHSSAIMLFYYPFYEIWKNAIVAWFYKSCWIREWGLHIPQQIFRDCHTSKSNSCLKHLFWTCPIKLSAMFYNYLNFNQDIDLYQTINFNLNDFYVHSQWQLITILTTLVYKKIVSNSRKEIQMELNIIMYTIIHIYQLSIVYVSLCCLSWFVGGDIPCTSIFSNPHWITTPTLNLPPR